MPKTSRTPANRINPLLLFLAIGMTLLSGFIGSIPTASGLPWYATLQKPSFTPPSFLFAPVWTLLYIFIGIVLYRILSKKPSYKRKQLMVLFVIQFMCNILWSILFFGLKNPYLALLNIIILLYLISRLIFKLIRYDSTSAYLLTPYFLWVSFASVLNYSVWSLNA